MTTGVLIGPTKTFEDKLLILRIAAHAVVFSGTIALAVIKPVSEANSSFTGKFGRDTERISDFLSALEDFAARARTAIL